LSVKTQYQQGDIEGAKTARTSLGFPWGLDLIDGKIKHPKTAVKK